MSQYAPVLDLATLDGVNGFRLDGPAIGAQSGATVAYAGDVNGDGIDDLIVGAPGQGSAYVVFGSATSPGPYRNLAVLDGTNGFQVSGPSSADHVGSSVASAGDVNGDGIDDIIVGGSGADSTYVVFGSAAGFSSDLDLTALDGSNGFRIDGGYIGSTVGDVNGDGIDDFAVTSPYEGSFPNNYHGVISVFYGHAAGAPWSASFDTSTATGSSGYAITGGDSDFQTGFGSAITALGDFNGDGLGDFAVTDPGYRNPRAEGAAFIYFGQESGPAIFGGGVFGSSQFHGFRVGTSLSGAGDVNGDGKAEAIFQVGPAGAYVLFGGDGVGVTSGDQMNGEGSAGFELIGYITTVSGAGDVNGDGFDDMLVTTPKTDTVPASIYVVFGRPDFPAGVYVSSMDGNTGFRIDGVNLDEMTGAALTAGGDLNGDGLADIVIGAPKGDNEGLTDSGTTYVVYGALPGEAVTRIGSAIGQTIHGSDFADLLSGLGGDDRLIGHDGDDTLDGGAGDDTMDGGGGKDTVSYASATAGVVVDLRLGGAQDTGGAGTDTLVAVDALIGSAFADHLTGDTDASSLVGRGGNDTLIGGGGGDTLDGGAGADEMNGRGGRDLVTYAGAASAVSVDLSGVTANGGGAAGDVLDAVEDLLGSSFADALTGDARENHFRGGNGDDLLQGAGGGDSLEGDAGKDTLTGGAGADTLTGGGGSDVFAFASVLDCRLSGPDTITDLANVDRIDLSAIDADKHLAGDQAFHLVDAFTHHAGELVLTYDSGSDRTSLTGDINGDGLADFQVWIDGDRHQFGNFVL